MKDKKVNLQLNKKSVNPVMAAMVGAVAAGVAVAGAMLMSDKKNQDKIKKVVSSVKDNLNKKKALVADKVNKLGDITKNAVSEVKNI